jgi:glycosyltransferase involved in cell wall biosynthesis
MKVLLFITRGDSIGGAQTHVISIAKTLLENHNEVLIVFGGHMGPFNHLLEKMKINYINIPELFPKINIFQDYKVFITLSNIVKEYRPDIVSLHSSKAGIIGRLVGTKLRIPVVLTVHGWSFTGNLFIFNKFIYYFIEKFLNKYVNYYILVSKFDFTIGLKYGLINNNNSEVVYNGVNDLTKLYNSKKIINKSKLRIIMVSRFDELKDHKLLIKACEKMPNVVINFLGDGPTLSKIKNYYMNSNCMCTVNFHGSVYDVGRYLAENDVFALISQKEGFPMSTLEAMSFGLPVIISDVGGAAECVFDNGFVVKMNDLSALRNSISYFINNFELIDGMGAQSRKIYENSFTENIMYEKTINVFNNTILKYHKI